MQLKTKIKLFALGMCSGACCLGLTITVVVSFANMVTSAASSMDMFSGNTDGDRISFANTDGNTRSLLDTALCFLGTPYVFGQATTTSTDCSGFTQQAYALAGTSVGLPHNAYDQSKYGTVVFDSMYGSFTMTARKDGGEIAIQSTGGGIIFVQPGDLIFFNFGQAVTDGTAPIGHVAMYIGNGQIIQSLNEEKGNLISCLILPSGGWNTDTTDHIVLITHLLDYDSTQQLTTDLTGNPIKEITANDVYYLGYYLQTNYATLTNQEQYEKAVEIVNLARANKTSISQEVSSILKVYASPAGINVHTQRIVRCALIGMYWDLPAPTTTPTPTASAG